MSDASVKATDPTAMAGAPAMAGPPPAATDGPGATPASRAPSADAISLGTVLLATDLGVTTREASRQAIVLAARLRSRLLIVHVLDARRAGPAPVASGRPFAVRAERETDLLELVRRAHAAGVHAEFLLWEGDPAEAIAAAASSEHADILVVGSRGRRGAERALLGSVSDELIRIASCPVMVVRPDLVTAE
jgi:nucleotide-binding universal stress UspA family protein